MVRMTALVVLAAGAAASLMFMFRGHGNAPRFLMVLFTGWVLSPFVALAFASIASKKLTVVIQATVNCVALIISAVSVAAYAGLIPMPSGSRPAFLFLMVPFVSWVLMTLLALALWRAARRQAVKSSGL